MLILVFYILVGLHFIHLIRLCMPIISYKKVSNTSTPPFSIIIAARNELNNLKELLPLMLSQQYPDFEVIIALDRCTDGSLEYLERLNNKTNLRLVNIREVPAAYNGKKYALTQAIKTTKNDWLLLTDADCRPASPFWIESFAKAISEQTSIIIGVSPYHQQHSLLNQFIQYETTYTAMKYISAAIQNKPYMAVGRNLAYKKSLFLSENGFSPYETIVGGDDDLLIQKYGNNVNTKVVIEKNGITHSKSKTNLRDYLLQKTRHLHVGKLYKEKNVHIYWTVTHGLLWLCFIYLVLAQPINIGVISTFILLILIKGLIFNLSSRSLGYNYNPLFLPISDLIYGVLYPFIGIRALLLRKVKWK
ncbi:MAG: glycosyltransferase [Cyclobacteriaceae bacterium]